MPFCFVVLVFSAVSPCFFLYCALRFFLCSSGLIFYGIFGSKKPQSLFGGFSAKMEKQRGVNRTRNNGASIFRNQYGIYGMHGRMKGDVVCAMLLRALLTCLLIFDSTTDSLLYPRESENRQLQELNGMWNFRADTSATRDVGMKQKWFDKPLAKVK